MCAEVYWIERHAELAATAEETLVRLGYSNEDPQMGWLD
jgi:protein-L-isoaspartate O-methyltransferase